MSRIVTVTVPSISEHSKHVHDPRLHYTLQTSTAILWLTDVMLMLINDGVVCFQRDVLAAAAADADQHLFVGAPVALAHYGVDCPRKSEVE